MVTAGEAATFYFINTFTQVCQAKTFITYSKLKQFLLKSLIASIHLLKLIMDDSLIKILEKEKGQLLLKLNLVEQAIDTFKNSEVIIPGHVLNEDTANLTNSFQQNMQALFQKYHHYNSAAPTRDKILFIIKAENRFLHVREIAKIIQQLEDEILLSAVIKKISPALSTFKRIPGSPLASIEVGHSHFNTFWGCRDWLNEDGCVKDDFMYNQAEITKFQKRNGFALIV